jgi:hypothetical protein
MTIRLIPHHGSIDAGTGTTIRRGRKNAAWDKTNIKIPKLQGQRLNRRIWDGLVALTD